MAPGTGKGGPVVREAGTKPGIPRDSQGPEAGIRESLSVGGASGCEPGCDRGPHGREEES